MNYCKRHICDKTSFQALVGCCELFNVVEALLDKVERRTFLTTAKGTFDHLHGSITQHPYADHLEKAPRRRIGHLYSILSDPYDSHDMFLSSGD